MLSVAYSESTLLNENLLHVGKGVNLSTPGPKGWSLLEVHPEPGLSTPPSKAGLRAAERVKLPAHPVYGGTGHSAVFSHKGVPIA